MFVAGPGNVLVDADYSQIELRLLAHIAGDEHMISAFRSGEDIHTITAGQVFGVPPELVTRQMRSAAKAVNFGIVYGISDFSLSQDIGVTRKEAKAYMERYFERYSGVHAYMTDIVEQARKSGFVSTLMGRRRWLPELKSSNFNMRSFGERVALNMPIQGTAANIIKLAMIRVDARLRSEGLKARLVLQVHDELIVECPEAEAGEVKDLLTEEMEGVVALAVPLIGGRPRGQELGGGPLRQVQREKERITMNYQLVPMDPSHLEGVAALERTCFSTPGAWRCWPRSFTMRRPPSWWPRGRRQRPGLRGAPCGAGRGLYRQCGGGPGLPAAGDRRRPHRYLCPVRRGQAGLPHPGGAGGQRTRHRPL